MGALYSEVQCIMGNGHMETPPPVKRKTDMSEIITFPQLHWQAVIKAVSKQFNDIFKYWWWGDGVVGVYEWLN